MSQAPEKYEHHPDRLFYTIGEVAEMFDVKVSLIRYWAQEFAVIQPKRNAKGNRLFTPSDVDNFHLIYYLVKDCGMTLGGAKKRMEKADTRNQFEIVKRLKNVKERLQALSGAFKDLENKS